MLVSEVIVQADGGALRVVLPPRRRLRSAFNGVVCTAAGVLMGLLSTTGIVSSFQDPSLGLRLFHMAWLGPLAIVAALLVWLGLRLTTRVWQSDVIESDGVTFRHRLEGPFERTEFEAPIAGVKRLLALDVPQAERERYRGSLFVTAVVPKGESTATLQHRCVEDIGYDDHATLVSVINGALPEDAPSEDEE